MKKLESKHISGAIIGAISIGLFILELPILGTLGLILVGVVLELIEFD